MAFKITLTGALAFLLILAGAVAVLPAGPAAAQAASDLEGSRWILASYLNASGKTVSALSDRAPSAEFESGRVSGSAGCNTYAASYTAGDGKLTIGPAVTTLMACAPTIMHQEAAYLKALESAATFRIEGDRLTLRTAKGATRSCSTVPATLQPCSLSQRLKRRPFPQLLPPCRPTSST